MGKPRLLHRRRRVKSRHKENRNMKEKMKYVAVNMRPECDPTECLECPYFDTDTGHCSADEKIKGCKYCSNAFSDLRLDAHHDLSYLPIGNAEKGFAAFVRASAEYKPPVCIVVQTYREDIKQNVGVMHYTPAYCPVCGREIIENKKYLQEK